MMVQPCRRALGRLVKRAEAAMADGGLRRIGNDARLGRGAPPVVGRRPMVGPLGGLGVAWDALILRRAELPFLGAAAHRRVPPVRALAPLLPCGAVVAARLGFEAIALVEVVARDLSVDEVSQAVDVLLLEVARAHAMPLVARPLLHPLEVVGGGGGRGSASPPRPAWPPRRSRRGRGSPPAFVVGLGWIWQKLRAPRIWGCFSTGLQGLSCVHGAVQAALSRSLGSQF